MAYDSDVAVQSISFRPDGLVEVTYAEQRDISDSISLVKVIMYDSGFVAQAETAELLDATRELVDAVLVAQREQKMKLAGRQ